VDDLSYGQQKDGVGVGGLASGGGAKINVKVNGHGGVTHILANFAKECR